MLDKLIKELRRLKNPQKAKVLTGFFKTGKGEYGEGDIFWGITIPDQRKIALKYQDLKLEDIGKLLSSKIHEFRLTATLILVSQFKKADGKTRQAIFNFYLANTKYINNWDLVDLSAPNIIGENLLGSGRSILYKLARSSNLWERRIAIIATYAFIKNNEFSDTLKIAQILLSDKHDLVHKAVGWMLREIGKRDRVAEERFLKRFYLKMPRTMLRYAIERFDEKTRRHYLA